MQSFLSKIGWQVFERNSSMIQRDIRFSSSGLHAFWLLATKRFCKRYTSKLLKYDYFCKNCILGNFMCNYEICSNFSCSQVSYKFLREILLLAHYCCWWNLVKKEFENCVVALSFRRLSYFRAIWRFFLLIVFMNKRILHTCE